MISSSQGKEIDVKKAISVIQKKESEIRSMEWNCSVEREFVGKKVQPLGKAAVYYDHAGRFRVNTTQVIPWDGGTAPFIYHRSLLTYDGRILRTEEAQKGVNSNILSPALEEEEIIAMGYVRKGFDSNNGGINWHGHPEGIGYTYPYMGAWGDVEFDKTYPLHRFSQMLQEIVKQKKEIHVYENDEGVWDIVYHIVKVEDTDIYCRIVYDPNKGRAGTINKIFRESKQHINNTDLVPMIAYEFQQCEDFYVPSKIKILFDLDKAGKPAAYDVYTFNGFKVNKEFSDTDFQIDWQYGTNVHDHIAKQFYVATDDPVDEAEAVRAYQNIHGQNNVSFFENNRRNVMMLGLVIPGLSLIVYARYRNRRR